MPLLLWYVMKHDNKPIARNCHQKQLPPSTGPKHATMPTNAGTKTRALPQKLLAVFGSGNACSYARNLNEKSFEWAMEAI